MPLGTTGNNSIEKRGLFAHENLRMGTFLSPNWTVNCKIRNKAESFEKIGRRNNPAKCCGLWAGFVRIAHNFVSELDCKMALGMAERGHKR